MPTAIIMTEPAITKNNGSEHRLRSMYCRTNYVIIKNTWIYSFHMTFFNYLALFFLSQILLWNFYLFNIFHTIRSLLILSQRDTLVWTTTSPATPLPPSFSFLEVGPTTPLWVLLPKSALARLPEPLLRPLPRRGGWLGSTWNVAGLIVNLLEVLSDEDDCGGGVPVATSSVEPTNEILTMK